MTRRGDRGVPLPTSRRLVHRVGPSGSDRAVAVLAGVLGTMATVSLSFGVPGHLALVTWMVVSVLTLLFAVTELFTTRHPGRRRVALIAAVAATASVTGAVAVAAADEDGLAHLLVMGVLALSGATVSAKRCLVVAPPLRRSFFTVPHDRRVTRSPVLVCNPRSGGGKVHSSGLLPLCDRLGIATVVLEEHDDLAAVAQSAIDEGADALGMAGGDGSLAVVAEVAHRNDVPFVVVPAGTRNHLALDLGLDRDDPRQALAGFLCGEEHRLDRGEVNGRWFLNNVTLGIYAAAVSQDDYRDAKVTTVLDELPEIVETAGEAYDITVEVPGKGPYERVGLVMVSNGTYLLRPPRAFGRRDALDAGQLGIIVVNAESAADLVRATARASLSDDVDSSTLIQWEAATFEARSGQPSLPVGADGEAITCDTPVRIRVHPGELRVLLPPGTDIGYRAQYRLRTDHSIGGLLDVIRADPAD